MSRLSAAERNDSSPEETSPSSASSAGWSGWSMSHFFPIESCNHLAEERASWVQPPGILNSENACDSEAQLILYYIYI